MDCCKGKVTGKVVLWLLVTVATKPPKLVLRFLSHKYQAGAAICFGNEGILVQLEQSVTQNNLSAFPS